MSQLQRILGPAPKAFKMVSIALVWILIASAFGGPPLRTLGGSCISRATASAVKSSYVGVRGAAQSEAQYVKLVPSSRRAEFRLYLAWRRAEANTATVAKAQGLPRDEDFVVLVPRGRQAEFRKYLASAVSNNARPLSAGPPPVLDLPSLVQKVKACVVNIRAGNSSGTGFISGGCLFTCAHVVAGALTVQFENKYGVHGSVGRVCSLDSTRDLAVFYTGQPGPSVAFGDFAGVSTGSQIAIVGDPMGLEETVTTGIVSAKREVGGLQLLQLSASVAPGSSGSPVFNMRGQVVGMVRSRFTDEPAYGFALGVPELMEGYIGGSMGVALSDLRSTNSLKNETWAPDEVRNWNSEFRTWAKSALRVLEGIDVAGLGYSSRLGMESDQRVLQTKETSLATNLTFARRCDALADSIDKSPGSLLYWFQAYDFMYSIADTLSDCFTDFSSPGWTGAPSVSTLQEMVKLVVSGRQLQLTMYPKLVTALGWKPNDSN